MRSAGAAGVDAGGSAAGIGAAVGPAGSAGVDAAAARAGRLWCRVRLRGPWLLVVPFLVFAQPTPRSLVLGGVVALLGCGLRSWAAGHIRKKETLAVTGPYAHLRHPLYAGSLLLGLGVTVAAARLSFYVAFALFFLVVYIRTARGEDRGLERRFGDAFRGYRAGVRGLIPRVTPYRPEGAEPGPRRRFSPGRWLRNREYEAVLGTVAGIGALALKMVLFP